MRFRILYIMLIFILAFTFITINTCAQNNFSLILTYDLNDLEHGNDIFGGNSSYEGQYYYKQFSFYFFKNHDFFFYGAKATLQYYYPFFDKALDLIWINPSISLLIGVIANDKDSIFIIKTGFFFALSYPYIENNQQVLATNKIFLADGPFFSLGIKLTEKINLVINFIYQSDITSLFSNSYEAVFYSTNYCFGLEYYL
ncbi:MAG: hypothetical protein KBG82_07500 [Spirochaetes bacterium]|nr:hypothetical protein [Spirochaetota bacterium]MBP8991806.1 hypothetical protein [Spirochaetota bacterium]